MSQAGSRPSGERAFTNPLSNVVVLSAFNMGEGMDTAGRRKLPLRCAPQFLHEVTHHWCFDSPVGLVLTLLQMRARRRALAMIQAESLAQVGELASESSSDDVYDILEDVIRVDATLEIMRPLSEGLALFAEHDLVPGHTKIISRPSLLASVLFVDPEEREQEHFEILPGKLAEVRLEARHIRRKADLLLQPLSCHDGGYLAGYLTVKYLYRMVISRSDHYLDPDFFFHYLRCVMYEDWDLVVLLLDDSINEYKVSSEVVRHCQQRLVDFLNHDHALSTRVFESRGMAGDTEKFTYRGEMLEIDFNYYSPLASSNLGQAKIALSKLLDELFGTWPDEPLLQSALRTDLDILGLRSTITIAHGLFKASITRGRMLQLFAEGFDFPVFATGAPNGLDPGWKDTVRAELIVTTSPPGLFFFIGCKGHIIHQASFGEDSTVHDYLITPLIDWERREELGRAGDAAVETVLQNSGLNAVLEDVRARIADVREQIFISRAFPVPDSLLSSMQNWMKRDGFLPVLNGDLALLLDGAALSLCAPFGVNPGEILAGRKWSCATVAEVISEFNLRVFQRGGYQPFVIYDGRPVFSLV
jgi:hypothetical protein